MSAGARGDRLASLPVLGQLSLIGRIALLATLGVSLGGISLWLVTGSGGSAVILAVSFFEPS